MTSLTADNIYFPNYDSNSANYLANTARLLAQGVDVTLRKDINLQKGTIEMGGGTLNLVQGVHLSQDGVIDVSNGVLALSGPFYNNGGTLTTSASTLRLNSNVKFEPHNAVTFDTFEPNGWGLVLYGNNSHLTLGGNLTLQPNAESLTSGFVNYYYPAFSWTEQNSPSTTHLTGVGYGNGTFVAVGNSGTIYTLSLIHI